MAVAAVIADDAIGSSQVGADADGDRLLAAIRVNDAMDAAIVTQV